MYLKKSFLEFFFHVKDNVLFYFCYAIIFLCESSFVRRPCCATRCFILFSKLHSYVFSPPTVSLPTTLIAAMTDNDIFPVKSFFCPHAKTLYAHQNCNISAAEWSLGHFAINFKECTAYNSFHLNLATTLVFLANRWFLQYRIYFCCHKIKTKRSRINNNEKMSTC
jgi:hypothetical protein